jgi:penicillin amidase
MDELRVEGIDAEVVVHRDKWGIPHVRAGSAFDAFFGQGFVQAADRLGQLDYDRRRAYGRWAEVAGESAVAFDRFARRCGLDRAARHEYDALGDESRAVLDAFAAGVNAWLALDCPLPTDLALVDVRPQRWEPWDCSAVFLVRHVVFANWQKKLWRGRLASALGAEAVASLEGKHARDVPLIVPPGGLFAPPALDARDLGPVTVAMGELAESAGGSNSWVLAGTRTASGLPIVAGDPHRLIEVPGVYAQVHLACDEFDAAGLSFVGVPGFPHFGCSTNTAWCVTNANGDYQDLYVERFAEGSPARYEAAGEWREAEHRDEVITVRDQAPVHIDCWETRHGPIVFGDPASGHAISMRSTALAEPSTGLAVVLPMLRARSVDELDAVMGSWVDPVNNFVSADTEGTIAYRTVGRVPVRTIANAWGPVPGWTDDHEWHGDVPYDEMPRVVNPATGLIVTANQRIVDDSYGHYLGLDYARPDRALRIHDQLDAATSVTVDDMAAVHRDRRSLAADVWVDRLSALPGADDLERNALERLRSWDRRLEADSVAASIYVVVRDAVGRRLAQSPSLAPLRVPAPDEPPSTFSPLEVRLWVMLTQLLANDDTTLFATGATWTDELSGALTEGIGTLRSVLGDDPNGWAWGRLHIAAPRHPLSNARHPGAAGALDPPGVGIGGEWDTVFSSSHPAGLGFGVASASVARYAFDLADRSQNRWVVPLGASGDAASPHFADQQQAWAAGELLPMCLAWDAPELRAETRLLRD